MLQLNRDCEATLIPSGEEVLLQEGSTYSLKQALGDSVTLSNEIGMFRISKEDLDALGGEGEKIRAQLDESTAASGTEGDAGEDFSVDLLWGALRNCYDPEIPVNIVDLGLIYDLRHQEAGEGQYEVEVKMTLTAQGCGMGPVIADNARQNLENLPCVSTAQVDIVWDPPWTPHMMSAHARQQLGLE
jgi:probable FeS assembly SUF system protein SufT